ncbi:MAG TPA: hypothetical protein EYH26_01860 [Pyrodictium sp.]|nr:hypothetical protein [Pyrodictium sp.]
MFRERFKAICFPFTISLFTFFVAVYLYMPSLSVFEADMSINVLKYVSVKAYTLLLLLLSFFVLLMSDSGIRYSGSCYCQFVLIEQTF